MNSLIKEEIIIFGIFEKRIDKIIKYRHNNIYNKSGGFYFIQKIPSDTLLFLYDNY